VSAWLPVFFTVKTKKKGPLFIGRLAVVVPSGVTVTDHVGGLQPTWQSVPGRSGRPCASAV
jgi:hypothetical protein